MTRGRGIRSIRGEVEKLRKLKTNKRGGEGRGGRGQEKGCRSDRVHGGGGGTRFIRRTQEKLLANSKLE